MQYEATIREKIIEATKVGKLFTSVDIANAVKQEGLWVRNRDVRDWLQDNFYDKSIFDGYIISQILVCNASSYASLYHPSSELPDRYLDRDQRPLTPDEVKAIINSKKGTPRDDTAPDIDVMLAPDDEDDIEMSVTLTSVERLKIPGAMIRALGWSAGQLVDPALILTHNVLPANLKVNDDYRVSVPRTAVNWGTNPVKVILKKGKIHFEKA
jgi:hypothetical protein